MNVWDLLLGFPAPIVLALLLNEIKFNPFKGAVQTVSYLPHFISLVVVVGMMVDFLARDGLINQILGNLFGMQPIAFMQQPQWFRPLYVLSGIWQGIGWELDHLPGGHLGHRSLPLRGCHGRRRRAFPPDVAHYRRGHHADHPPAIDPAHRVK